MFKKMLCWMFMTLVALTSAAWPTAFTPSADCTATTGAVISSTKWNNCMSSIQTGVNSIDNSRVVAGAAIVGSKLNLTSGTGRIVQTDTVTGDAPILSSAQTWNNAAETFTAWTLNVTDTASATASKLLDLKVGGVSKFSVAKDGSTTPSSLPVGSIIYYGGFTAPTGYLLGYGQAISRLTYSGLYAALSLQTTATTSSGNHVITGIPDTTGMVAGMPIDGTGIPAGQSSTVTITIATPGVVSWTGHGLQNGQPIVLSTDGALPTGLVAGTTYYVVARAADTFQLAATTGGMAINTTGSQSGTHTATTSGTIIVTVDSSSQLTLSANATASGSGVDIVVLPHGPGDHSTTFNVPDCRGRVMAGRDDMGGTAANRLASGVTGSRVGASGGAEQHVLTEAEMPIHSHTPAYNNVTGLIGSGGFAFAAGAQSTGASVDLTIATAGGGQPHPIVQPTLVTNCLVKAQ